MRWIFLLLLMTVACAPGSDSSDNTGDAAAGDAAARDAAAPDVASGDTATPDATANPNDSAISDSHSTSNDLSTSDSNGGSADHVTVDSRGRDRWQPDASQHDAGSNDASSPQGIELNPGWIGGACDNASECSNADPICEVDGFPSGMCTEACSVSGSGTYICPDTDYGEHTLNTITRCIDTGLGAARCVGECDFDKSPSGCRPGYVCLLRQRYNQPSSIFAVCLPEHIQSWPGEPAPSFDIGDSCGDDSSCQSLSCLNMPGGYCSKTMCNVAGCPDGSTCFALSSELHTCLKDCQGPGDCRQSDGYICDDDNTCWPEETTNPNWDPSVGSSDCNNAWHAGLSPCDSTPDDYIVINKTARNMALCQSGNLVDNYNVGLGFAPLGDKQQEGDGKTPEGVFYIPRLVPNSSYYKAFLLSYPDSADAARGLNSGLISQAQHDNIVSAQGNCTEPPQNTPLGGLIEVHGMGGGQDWTLGCIAIENLEVDVLWSTLGVDDTIVVLP